ncbi:MAG: hypothetical protein DHS80DRAFT_23742 [Piptocephalis tieghemiana]|nr:MAG: hypothetical protein DHS80DRAFT_23742 [Piptocephalis tieghemiana]
MLRTTTLLLLVSAFAGTVLAAPPAPPIPSAPGPNSAPTPSASGAPSLGKASDQATIDVLKSGVNSTNIQNEDESSDEDDEDDDLDKSTSPIHTWKAYICDPVPNNGLNATTGNPMTNSVGIVPSTLPAGPKPLVFRAEMPEEADDLCSLFLSPASSLAPNTANVGYDAWECGDDSTAPLMPPFTSSAEHAKLICSTVGPAPRKATVVNDTVLFNLSLLDETVPSESITTLLPTQ